MFVEHLFFVIRAGFLRNPLPFDAISYKKNHAKNKFLRDFCDPCRIQTCNPHIRSVVLYSVELTDHASFQKRVQRYYKKSIYANFLKEKCIFYAKYCIYA